MELTSAHNVITLTGVKAGDHVFMTSLDMEDLSPGDPGILVEVISLAITMKRSIEFTNPLFFEERERMLARMQVRYCGTSLVKQVETRKLASPITIESREDRLLPRPLISGTGSVSFFPRLKDA